MCNNYYKNENVNTICWFKFSFKKYSRLLDRLKRNTRQGVVVI